MTQRKYPTDIETLSQMVKKEFFRSPGPGGQNVNKRDTAVRLRFPLDPPLPDGTEELVVEAKEERSQARNLEVAFKRLRDKLIRLNKPPKKRLRTKVPRREKRKRFEEKRRRGEIKKLRRTPED